MCLSFEPERDENAEDDPDPFRTRKNSELLKSGRTDPLLARLKRQTASLDVEEASNRWREKDKLGHLDVSVYASADEASKGLAAFNAFSRG
jgi:hypothetical protein